MFFKFNVKGNLSVDIIALLILLLPSCSSKIPSPVGDLPLIVSIDRVIDGDTIRLRYPLKVMDGDKIVYVRSVRYIGIDTPETNEPYYKSAKELNKSLLRKKKARLEFDTKKLDRSGNRLLAYVFVDDVFVNAEIISRGYASAYVVQPNVKYESLFKELEDKAKQNQYGIWRKNTDRRHNVVNQQEPIPVEPSANTATGKYIASERSKVFHTSTCSFVDAIAPENKIYFDTIEEALRSGRRPCKKCQP